MIRVRSLLFCDENDVAGSHDHDSAANEVDYIELGLSSADVCRVLVRERMERNQTISETPYVVR